MVIRHAFQRASRRTHISGRIYKDVAAAAFVPVGRHEVRAARYTPSVQDCVMTNHSPLQAIFALAPRLRRASSRALSIYLPARSEGYDARFYDIEFRDLLHRYKDRLSPKDRELMDYEMRHIGTQQSAKGGQHGEGQSRGRDQDR